VTGDPRCRLCGSPQLEGLPGFASLPRVTSDCRPWPPGGELVHCGACGLVQKPAASGWRREQAALYRDYELFRLGGTRDQPLFDARGQGRTSRSRQLLSELARVAALPRRGRLLDVGCGKGAFLAACSAGLPGWSLEATELDERSRARLEAIPGFARLHVGPPEALGGSYDLVSLVHVLEHLEEPAAALRALAARVAPGGGLFVEVPDRDQNPFDLVVADHASHFTRATLRRALEAAGLELRSLASAWVPKELSAFARPGPAAAAAAGARAPGFKSARAPADRASAGGGAASDAADLRAQLEWLERVCGWARARARDSRRSLGIFGTALAGSWLAGAVGKEAAFFVDEDPARTGGLHLERPVLAPAGVPPGALVLVAAPPAPAQALARRLAAAHRTWTPLPPPGL
jgi:SAM-dependent methyltransferase